MGEAQHREVGQGEAHRVEQRDLLRPAAPDRPAVQHLGQLRHRVLGRQLLDLALDAGLRGELHHDPVHRREHPGVELGLAGAVPADRVQVQAGPQVLRTQHRLPRLCGGAGGDHVRALQRLLDAARRVHTEAPRCEVSAQRLDRGGVEVERPHLVQAEHGTQGEGLEGGLRTGADHRVHPGAGTRHLPRGQGGHGGGAQRGQQGHLGQQQRVPGGDVGIGAEGGDGLQAAGRVAGVAVDVLEGEVLAVRDGHQLDHPDRGVAGDARRLLHPVPARPVLLQGRDQACEHGLDPVSAQPGDHPGHVQQRHPGAGCGAGVREVAGGAGLGGRAVRVGRGGGGTRAGGVGGGGHQRLLSRGPVRSG